jgi:prepilin-type N-terminal cleavage/methylation domain-containing protein
VVALHRFAHHRPVESARGLAHTKTLRAASRTPVLRTVHGSGRLWQTLNNEHRTPNAELSAVVRSIRCSVFDVQCSMFPIFPQTLLLFPSRSAISWKRGSKNAPGRGKAARRASSNAFTLVEMMVVMVLIGILTAMILPEMKGTFEDALLRSTSRDLVNVIELASSRAISRNQTLRVNLNPATGRYQIERLRRGMTGEDFMPLDDVAGGTGRLDQRITVEIHPAAAEAAGAEESAGAQVENPEPDLIFYPDGTAEGATILLKDRAGFRLALRVNPVTSRVTILEPAHE